jgi:hypothetical protein
VPDQERPAVASETAKPTSSEPKHPAVAVEATKIKPPAVITHSVKIKVPTKKDYQKVPDTYVPGRPLLTRHKIMKLPLEIKRLHDWYMRASSVQVDSISVKIPKDVFATIEDGHAIVTFKDIHLMFNQRRIDVQLVTLFCM